jgi:hypothetical protein
VTAGGPANFAAILASMANTPIVATKAWSIMPPVNSTSPSFLPMVSAAAHARNPAIPVPALGAAEGSPCVLRLSVLACHIIASPTFLNN